MTKAILLAAGRGSRVNVLTETIPKCMISIEGKTLIQRHIEGLNSVGVDNIAIVAGYMSEKIDFDNVKKFLNPDFASTNMIYSLNCAKNFFESDTIVLYADVLLNRNIYKLLTESKENISILVDKNWKRYWKFRFGENISQDLEKLTYHNGKILEIGEGSNLDVEQIDGRYVGGIIVPKSKIKYFKEVDHFVSNASKIDFTSYLSNLIQMGEVVEPILIDGGWYEIDTYDDYSKLVEASEEDLKDLNLDLY